MQGLDALFGARSVALIGISADARKMTGAPVTILKQTGFPGAIYPINPKYKEIGGLACWPDVESLPETPDVAMVMLAAARVPDAVRACARKGVRAVVVLSSGFEETEEGHAHARELAEVAREAGIAVVGPNCEGVWSVPQRACLTFGSAARREVLHDAPIAILSQSGAMAGALARHLQDSAVGCAYVVSVGNETVLTIADYLEWMVERTEVRVVLLFIEGLRDGQRLLRLVERATAKDMRVVALKSGNSVKGLEAAASHTGKMASPYAVYRDLLHEAGAIRVESLTELIEAAEVLSVLGAPPVRGADGGVSVFSIPGGTRAMTADALEAHGVPLATFSRETVAALVEALPEFGGTENPTDLTGQVLSHPGLFDKCLNLIADDPNTEALIVQVANRGPRDVMERVELLRDVAKRSGVPLVVSFLGDSLPAAQRTELRKTGVSCARDPVEASRFLGWLWRARAAASHDALPDRADAGSSSVPATWRETVSLLEDCGMKVPAWRVVAAGEDAATACEGLAFPVAVKALPEHADHKTELDLVRLNVGESRLAAEVEGIRKRLGQADAGVLVQSMDAGGVEVLLSALNNPDFGAILAIGMGGTATELHADVAYVALPTTPARVRNAIERLKLRTLLDGFRGRPPADTEALLKAAAAFGDRFVAMGDAVRELEINPLFVHARGTGEVVAVDALVKT
ncbi:acetate--CoA ligase family protein [Ramlibacter sp.]|uniref:acetate--CoA ligase family protein n=1 Tax=Ramlibacter sp. TaxID=1917967 RepID=UPI003D0BE08C